MTRRFATFALAIGAWCGNVLAHDGENHTAASPVFESMHQDISAAEVAAENFPLDFGGEFELIDQYGEPRNSADYRGEHLLVFFGYTSCPFMCSQTLRSLAAALDALGDETERVNAVMITVDPEHDTPEQMRAEMPKVHARIVGLTGSPEQLDSAYRAFRIEPRAVEAEWNGSAVISHSSYIYLLGPDGRFRTLMPPILPPAAMAEIIARYVDAAP